MIKNTINTESIGNLKKKSKRRLFASIIGKSTIEKSSEEYQRIIQVTQYLILKKDFGVIHGGYEGGAMSAVSDTANQIIEDKKLPLAINIGMPQVQHDGLWPRVNKASFTESAKDIQDRLRMVLAGDIIVVAPLGGNGTHLEITLAFHENVIRDYRNKKGHNEKIQPIIFLCTKNGTNWEKLIDTTIKTLDNGKNSAKDYSWIYFAHSLEEFKKIMDEIF